VRYLLRHTDAQVVNLDRLTYAGNLESLADVAGSPQYAFVQANICDSAKVREVFCEYRPSGLFHLAAESHVDRSIDGPAPFISTNIMGTFILLTEALRYYEGLDDEGRQKFRFLHVSTDEVFGSLGAEGQFTEDTAYRPNSPYSASKAASDHLVRAWQRTYGLPAVITNSSNNYGPYQFPEKLIPVVILSALEGKPIPVYGAGKNVRDWIYVEDHARALTMVMEAGIVGARYNVGGLCEKQNLEVVETVCGVMDELRPLPGGRKYRQQIAFVEDRPGHDFRYAIDSSKLVGELGWRPLWDFPAGIKATVAWYLENGPWWRRILSGEYRLERLGVKR
jgi:dTDP-glucose 4,6-dehydratase